MSRYRKSIHVPRFDEEPELDDLMYHERYGEAQLDFMVESRFASEQESIIGNVKWGAR
jgi:hypothetical protein